MNEQALRGHLDLLLLSIVDDGAKHGYAIIDELRARSAEAFDLPEGTVYPALHRLEKAGHLESDWSVVSGRKRRTYRLSPQGRSALQQMMRDWDRFSGAVTRIVRTQP